MLIFVSFADEDRRFARSLAHDLEHHNLPVSRKNLEPVARTAQDTPDELHRSTHFVPILSKVSVLSDQVLDEIEVAARQKLFIVPIEIEECVAPRRLVRFSPIKFQRKYDEALSDLVHALVPHVDKSTSITSFRAQIESTGFQSSVDVLQRDEVRATEVTDFVREAFHLAKEDNVVCIKRLRKGNGLPLAIQTVYLQPRLCEGILERDLSGLMKLYGEYGYKLVNARESIRCRRATVDEAKLLEMEYGDPVFVRERISYDENAEPFEVLHSVDVGGRVVYNYELALKE